MLFGGSFLLPICSYPTYNAPQAPLERICGAVRTMLRIVRIQPQLSVRGVLGHSPKRVLVWGPRRDARPAGERRSGGALEGCLSHRDSDPTWSKARDDAHIQK